MADIICPALLMPQEMVTFAERGHKVHPGNLLPRCSDLSVSQHGTGWLMTATQLTAVLREPRSAQLGGHITTSKTPLRIGTEGHRPHGKSH